MSAVRAAGAPVPIRLPYPFPHLRDIDFEGRLRDPGEGVEEGHLAPARLSDFAREVADAAPRMFSGRVVAPTRVISVSTAWSNGERVSNRRSDGRGLESRRTRVA
jgi:hypothetical protein